MSGPPPPDSTALAPDALSTALAAGMPIVHEFSILGRRYVARTDLPAAVPPLLHRLAGFLAAGAPAAGAAAAPAAGAPAAGARRTYLLCSRDAYRAALASTGPGPDPGPGPGAGDAFLVNGGRALGFLDLGLAIYYGEGTLLLDVMADAREAVFLHAAAVGYGASGALLAGEGGSGKSGLALEFLARGWRVLSDDFCPLAVGSLEALPFPRGVCVKGRPGRAPRLSAHMREALPGVAAALAGPPDITGPGVRLWFCPVLAGRPLAPLRPLAAFILNRRPGRVRLVRLDAAELGRRLGRLMLGPRPAPRGVTRRLARQVAGYELNYYGAAAAADAIAGALDATVEDAARHAAGGGTAGAL